MKIHLNNNSHTTFNFTYVTTQLTSVNTRISCILNFKRNNSSALPFLDLSVRAMRVTKSVCEFAVESCVPIDGRWPEFALLMFMGTKFGLREKGTKEVTEFHSRPEIGGCLIGKSISIILGLDKAAGD